MKNSVDSPLARLDERLAAFQETTDRRLGRIEEKLDILNDQTPRHELRIASLERGYSRIWTVVSGLAVGLIIAAISFILQNINFVR